MATFWSGSLDRLSALLDDLPADHAHEITDPRWAGLAQRFGASQSEPLASSPASAGDDLTKEN